MTDEEEADDELESALAAFRAQLGVCLALAESLEQHDESAEDGDEEAEPGSWHAVDPPY